MKNAHDILTFLAVARTGSISSAARQLNQDPATVGRKISRLEEALKATLFAKSPRGYHMTEAGMRLQVHAEAIESSFFDIESAFLHSSNQLQGKVRIGAPEGCATFLLPSICAQLCDAHPDLVLEVVTSSREFDLLNREVDLSISVSRPTAKAIVTSHLADYKLQFAASADAGDPSMLPLISYIPELLVDQGLDIPAAYKTKTPVLRSNSVLVQWEWLKAGHGIGLVHDFALRRAPELVRVFPEFALDRSYFLNIRRDDTRFAKIQVLAQWLTDAISRDLAETP